MFAVSYITRNSPLADADTVKLVRMLFAADPRTVLQHVRLRKKMGYFSVLLMWPTIMCVLIAFFASLDLCYVLHYALKKGLIFSLSHLLPEQTLDHSFVGETHYPHMSVRN